MAGRVFGMDVKRIEDPRLLTGHGRYVDDFHLPGMVQAAFVRSSHAHALVKGIDAARATALPGVIAVWRLGDFGAEYSKKPLAVTIPHPMLKQPFTQTPLATDEVCFVGEPIAIVLAESRYIAEDAVAMIEVDYEPLPAVSDCLAALAPDAPRVHRNSPDNVVGRVRANFGDVEAAFANAPHVFKETHRQHRGGPHSMETRGVLASYDGATDLLTVWNSTQSPYNARRFLAAHLGRDEHKVRVIAPDVGGGFGPKAAYYAEDVAIPLAAMKLGRPVKWIEDRREHFLTTNQQRDSIWRMEVAADDRGKVLGVRGHVTVDNGAYVPYGILLAISSLGPLPGPYALPALDVTVESVFTNAVATSPVRGAGRPNAAYTLERLMDLVARELKLDRADVRRRNFVQRDQFPYATGMKARDGSPVSYDSGDYGAVLDKALALADYANFPQRQAAARAEGRWLGIGVSSCNEDTGMGPYEGATVRVTREGKILVQTGAAAQGQGLHTILAQIAAEALGVELDQVTVESADTANFPLGVATVGSRVAVTAGSSAHLAAMEVRAKALKLAAATLEVAEQDLVIEKGVVHPVGVPDMKVTLAELAAKLISVLAVPVPKGFAPGLEATSYYSAVQPAYASGSQAVEVEIDVETGAVELLRYSVAHDCGTLINPGLVDGQILGGVVHGIGNALFERMIYDESGQPLTTNYGEYLLPTATEVPRIALAHHETPSPLNPLGIKGAGEGGTIPAAAAIVSAVENALEPLGLRLTDHPLSPQRLLELIDAARTKPGAAA
ncbi:MAG TPA: xanthine dehydrogenase family protein molybdopterin-binding subunit [Alphaproteobacteria bacterium]|nr:xanthine dehydrogenase family protein molybdopterin-binding subunit [Alphaproteobacteria bacterium]